MTYSVTVAPAVSSRTPDGTVSISEGASILGGGTLTSQGILSASLSPLAPGIHLLTATYGGNANFQASSSAPLSLQILAQDFNLATSVSALSIETEHHAPLTVSLAVLGGLQDTANLSCDNLPPHATCTFASSRIALGAASESTQLMVDTDDVLYYAENSPAAMRGPVLAGVLAGSCGLLGMLLPAVRRRRRLLPWLSTLVLAAISMSMSVGCSGKYPAHTAPGQYTITVVAHAEQTGLTHTAQVLLNVTP